MLVHFVIARYEEDLNWVMPLVNALKGMNIYSKLFIYNKGRRETLPRDLLPYYHDRANVGRESETYLFHVCQHYNQYSNQKKYKEKPPFPCDRKLRQAVLALDVLALDEGQPDQLRRDACVLKDRLVDDGNTDWTWVVEHLAPSDKYATHLLKTAMDITPEPPEHDINVLLWFRLVKLEINDCWNDHLQAQVSEEKTIKTIIKHQIHNTYTHILT